MPGPRLSFVDAEMNTTLSVHWQRAWANDGERLPSIINEQARDEV